MAWDMDRQEQFRELIERHRGIVFKVANSYAWQPDDRQELAQEIAAQLWRAFPGYDPARPFPTWMYRIALNVAISFVRGNSRHRNLAVPLDQELHDLADGNGADHEADQQVRALHRFIHAQEPLDRALLLLYLEDRSYREIAEVLGISETNVATKISRLKQRIRNEL
ncbi:MAG: sigma-70 family RNA polymerase sigma factor [Pseudoxanthomonas sp.]